MSLDVSRLEEVKELRGGGVQARCPACAEGGHDRTGNHLRIWPDGRFGCCANAADREHRKRIYALAGRKPTGKFTVRLKAPAGSPVGQSVKAALVAMGNGTLGTGKSGLKADKASGVVVHGAEVGTLGTGSLNLRTRAGGMMDTSAMELKNLGSGVPNVPRRGMGEACSSGTEPWEFNEDKGGILAMALEDFKKRQSGAGGGVPSVPKGSHTETERRPFLTADGTLSIPFDSPARFHWWNGGQKAAETRGEVRASMQNEGHETAV